MSQSNIMDTTRPNAGRMNDYYLGGNHNFEVDRQAAAQIFQVFPFAPKGARLQRWCLQDMAKTLTNEYGFDTIIDFASGLPTQDHIHHAVPKGTTVIYSDYDPVTVEYSKEILKDIPDTHYFRADIRQPEELLNRPEVLKILAGNRNVAMIAWGIALFLTDTELAHIMKYLYKWSGKNSCLAFNLQGGIDNLEDLSILQMQAIYQQLGAPIYFRKPERFLELITPWKPNEKGVVDLFTWHGLDESTMTQEEKEAFDSGSGGFGVYLVK